jgi:uncharacterized RDD family membrane protein YckC
MEYVAQPESLPNTTFQMEKAVHVSVDLPKAPFYLRCAGFFIDYMLLLTVPTAWLIFGKFFGEGVGSSGVPPIVWYLVAVLWMIDFLALPLFRGQTFGKMLAGTTMLKTDGSPVRLGSLLLRNVLGYFLTVLTLGLGFLIAIVNKSGRALHDYVGGTVVVHGRRRRS